MQFYVQKFNTQNKKQKKKKSQEFVFLKLGIFSFSSMLVQKKI